MTALLAPFDEQDTRARLFADGYAVVDGVVSAEHLNAIRDFWLAEFDRPLAPAPLVWGPYLGEPNGICFDKSPTHCLYRSYDYLWNEPYHPLTREIALALSHARNRIAEADGRQGEEYTPDRYGIYITTSYYPAGSGWLAAHEDATDPRRHWHYIVPMTFRGTDFGGGGLYLTDRHGTRVDVEDRVKPGSVLFFDGRLNHGVDTIEALPGKTTGRLQLFAIPVLFEDPALNGRALQRIPVSAFVRAKLSGLKQRLFYR
jgi:hypothetical protein